MPWIRCNCFWCFFSSRTTRKRSSELKSSSWRDDRIVLLPPFAPWVLWERHFDHPQTIIQTVGLTHYKLTRILKERVPSWISRIHLFIWNKFGSAEKSEIKDQSLQIDYRVEFTIFEGFLTSDLINFDFLTKSFLTDLIQKILSDNVVFQVDYRKNHCWSPQFVLFGALYTFDILSNFSLLVTAFMFLKSINSHP